MNDIITIGVVLAIGLIALITSKLVPQKKNKWVDSQEFEQWKQKISRDCNTQNLQEFQDFLRRYGGGYVRRKHGKIVWQEFLGREKGDLKGIFYQLVVPSKQISITHKERFRSFLMEIGVTNVDKRPQYEGEIKEFDHIVIGENGIFILETKAFGLLEDVLKDSHAQLLIEGQDEWTLKKNGQSRILQSPTEQVMAQRDFMERFVEEFMTDINNVLILANPDLKLQKQIHLDYDVIQVQNLCQYIRHTDGNLPYNDRLALVSKINEHRKN